MIKKVLLTIISLIPIFYLTIINATPGHFQPVCNCCGGYEITYTQNELICEPCYVLCVKSKPTKLQQILLYSAKFDLLK